MGLHLVDRELGLGQHLGAAVLLDDRQQVLEHLPAVTLAAVRRGRRGPRESPCRCCRGGRGRPRRRRRARRRRSRRRTSMRSPLSVERIAPRKFSKLQCGAFSRPTSSARRVSVVRSAHLGVVCEVERADVHERHARRRGLVRHLIIGDARRERGVVGGVGPHRAGRCLGGLEPHRHHAPARAPHPAATHLGVHDVHARAPRSCAAAARGLDLGELAGPPRLGLAEQVLLDPVGQPGDADAEQPDAAGGVEVGEQRRGRAGRSCAVLSVGEVERRRPAQRGEVVQPHLDRDRAPGQAVLAQPVGDLARPAGSSSPSISLRSVRSVS